MLGLKRVAITGCGIYSALGMTPQMLFRNLLNGESAVVEGSSKEDFLPTAPAPHDSSNFSCLSRTLRRSMANSARFSAIAGLNAKKSSGLTTEELFSLNAGCAVGSTMGSVSALREGYRFLLEDRKDMLSPMQFFRSASHTTAFNLARVLGTNGPIYSPCSACASGLQAIGLGAILIATGQSVVMFCGGSDETGPEVSGSFFLMNAHAPRSSSPEQSPRPFAVDRMGLVCGEGAGILCLEEYNHAFARGASITGEIIGYSTNCGGSGLSQSYAPAIARCMRDACTAACLEPNQIDYISAHATSTLQGDSAEAEAIRTVFGSSVPVSSLKGHLGHTLGASGGLEFAALPEMAKNGVLIPTRNLLGRIDPVCGGIDHVTSVREKRIRTVLKNSFAFGGINASLVCRLYV